MEGTISLGIYDSAGKLVRVLHREAEVSEFTAELNGLVTRWDGADDQGAACPPGDYHARGFMVGDLEIEGVDFIGNDWVNDDEDTLRISRITDLAIQPNGNLVLKALVPGQAQPAVFGLTLKGPDAEGEYDPQLTSLPKPDFPEPGLGAGTQKGALSKLPVTSHPVDASPGADGAVWIIDGSAVKEYSAKGEVLRSLPVQPDEPAPIRLAASPTQEKVYLLEQNTTLQRLRALDFTGLALSAEPKVVFEQSIQFSDRFEQIASELTFPAGKPFVAEPALALNLVPNVLMGDKPGSVVVKATFDKTGSLLTTADGLPLYHISETPNLRWVAMGREHGSKIATVFQSDGAVVEQFTATRLANMMAFNAGEFKVTAATPTPAPTVPPPSPASSPVAPSAPTPAQP